jgi:hypothetical protein
MSRLSVSDEVRDVLSTAALERAIAQREHTELVCAKCGGTIIPEDPDPASVIVGFVDHDIAVLRFAHGACAPSHVDREARWAGAMKLAFSYVAMLRVRRVAAVLVWEPVTVLLDGAGREAGKVATYRSAGFVSSQDGLAETAGPFRKDWMLAGGTDSLVLRRGAEPVEEFDGVGAVAPAGWLDAARGERRCLLVVGETLGLDRPSPERIDALLADGRAVAAVVRAKIARS